MFSQEVERIKQAVVEMRKPPCCFGSLESLLTERLEPLLTPVVTMLESPVTSAQSCIGVQSSPSAKSQQC